MKWNTAETQSETAFLDEQVEHRLKQRAIHGLVEGARIAKEQKRGVLAIGHILEQASHRVGLTKLCDLHNEVEELCKEGMLLSHDLVSHLPRFSQSFVYAIRFQRRTLASKVLRAFKNSRVEKSVRLGALVQMLEKKVIKKSFSQLGTVPHTVTKLATSITKIKQR